MKWEQMTVPVRVETKQGHLLKHVRRAPDWRKAIRALLRDPRVKRAKSHPELELPPHGLQDGWVIRQSGIAFRCCVAYVPFPIDGSPPGFRGRVDVLCRYDA